MNWHLSSLPVAVTVVAGVAEAALVAVCTLLGVSHSSSLLARCVAFVWADFGSKGQSQSSLKQ